MAVPSFINSDGTPTKDGENLIEWIEAQFRDIDAANDITSLNRMSGPIADYYVNVYKLKAMTPARWLGEHSRSFAPSAWGIMKFIEEQAAVEQRNAETATKADAVASELEVLRAQLAEAVAEINALKEASKVDAVEDAEPEAKPRKSRKAKAAVDPDPDPEEGDDEGEDAASEA